MEKRIVRYEFADGTVCEFKAAVTPAVAEALAGFDRADENYARKMRRRNEASIEGMCAETGWEPEDTGADVEAEVLRREVLAALNATVSHLSEKQRRVIRLYYYEEKTFTEIAQILGINRRSVSKQLDTILKKLKVIFEKNCPF